ncbi:MAG: hypothetical protein ACOYU4_05265 [Thermodesulfobacteriota bacterium]
MPYWRFRGMLFSCEPYRVCQRVVDTTLLALNDASLPVSLGLRPQALKLKFAAAMEDARFLRPHLSFEQFFSGVSGPEISADDLAQTCTEFHRAFIGEVGSLVYSPIFIHNNVIYDAILDRPIATDAGNVAADERFSFEERPDWRIKFLPTLCPNCGWTLAGERESWALHCSNCDSVWGIFGQDLRRIDFGVVSDGGNTGSAIYLPFWRIRPRVEGLSLRSYADLVRLANLPKAIRKEWDDLDFYFWSPAFKIQPAHFLRLARQMTLSQPMKNLERHLPKSPLYPITLPMSDAADGLKIVLAQTAMDKKSLFPRLGEIQIQAEEFLLVYFPFAANSTEFIQPQLQCSIQRSALSFARTL